MSLRYYHFTFIVLNGGLPQIVDRKNRRQVKPSKSQKQNFASRPKRRQLFFFVQNVDNIFLQVVQIVDTINRYRLIERYISSSLTGRGVRGAEPPVPNPNPNPNPNPDPSLIRLLTLILTANPNPDPSLILILTLILTANPNPNPALILTANPN